MPAALSAPSDISFSCTAQGRTQGTAQAVFEDIIKLRQADSINYKLTNKLAFSLNISLFTS